MNFRVSEQTGRVEVEVGLANWGDAVLAEHGALAPEVVRRLRVSALVDASRLFVVLPKRIAEQLGLAPDPGERVRYVDPSGATVTVVEELHITLFGRHGTFKAVVEPDGQDVRLGAIVLEALDLIVDGRTQALRPRDPRYIIAEIE